VSIRAQGLVKRYGGRAVVNGASLEVKRGQIVGLLGPNGAGKTTTFYLITGLIRPNRGTITLGETTITHMPVFKRARLGLYYLPQEPSVFRKLSVVGNLQLALERQGLSRKQQRVRVVELLEQFHLKTLGARRADTLSSGERRRLEIARALAHEPSYLLLDEPFSGVDPISVEALQETIVELKTRGLGIVITDHSVRETLKVTDYAYLIHEGKVFLSGTPQEIVADPSARKFYLGQHFQLE